MKNRETNRKILFVFMLCAATIVAVTWTVAEKFIPNARVAFFVNLLAALCIAWLFERYLEAKLNSAIDFIIGKIRRVSQGDLTQVFKEDPDDILPFGLAYELGEMMKSFRENIGKLWKTSSLLVKQLNMFISSAQKVLEEFRAEVEFLSKVRASIEDVRSDTAELIKRLSALKVNAGSDMTLMKHVKESSAAANEGFAKGKEVHKQLLENCTNLRDSLSHLQEALEGFVELSRQAGVIEKAMSDLTTQTGLIKLNAAIDATQQHPDTENYTKIVEETRKIVDGINKLSEQSATMAYLSDEKIKQFADEIEQRRVDMKKGLDDVNKSSQLLRILQEKGAAASSGFLQVREHISELYMLLKHVDTQVSKFNDVIKASEGNFDKIYSDTNITLLKFNELGSKIDQIRDNLRQLEEFNRLFQIA